MRRKGKNRKELTSFVLKGMAFYQMILKRLVTLNKYFSSIGHQLATDIPEANTTISDYLDPPLQNSIYFDPIIPQEIETEISLLPYDKALGLYSNPVKLLKLAESAISIPLTGVYPAKLTVKPVEAFPSVTN